MGCCTADSCQCTSRFIIILLNVVLWAVAGVLFYIAAWAITSYEEFHLVSVRYVVIPAVVFIIIGVFVFITSIIGCCGVFQSNKCLLAMFFTFVLVIFALEIVSGSLAYHYRDLLTNGTRTEIEKAQSDYLTNPSVMNAIQSNAGCCGFMEYTDWSDTPWGMKNPGMVPDTCCKKDLKADSNCTGSIKLDINKIYKEGCSPTIEDLFKDNLAVIAGVAIGFAVIMFLAMVSACVLIFRKEDIPYTDIYSGPSYSR